MPYAPPYTITPKILSLVAQISEALTGGDLVVAQASPQLRRQNRIKSITGTLAIEGNTLNLNQVARIVDGKAVRGTQKEIAEVRGAIKAYEALAHYQPHRLKDLLDAHKKMTEEILPDTGCFRQGNVGIHAGKQVIHVGPQADCVQFLVRDLLRWLKQTDAHPLISSCVFHYEFEFIHPARRLWLIYTSSGFQRFSRSRRAIAGLVTPSQNNPTQSLGISESPVGLAFKHASALL